MADSILDTIAVDHREIARQALSTAFGEMAVAAIQPVGGGASGALTYRVDAAGGQYLMRLETRRGPLRNPHQYTCMQTAASAGVAPPLVHVDADAGVAIMRFILPRPLQAYPGGPAALSRDLGRLVARLQTTPAFPHLTDYLTAIDRMLGYLRRANVIDGARLDAPCKGFDRIREAYPWNADALVSSHNDPNPGNIIFDGERLWLVDWETAYRNDPLVDVAIVAENFAPTPELEDVLLRAWLDRPPDSSVRARLLLMRQVTRLYYAALGFSIWASSPAKPEGLYRLGEMCLARFSAGKETKEFAEALTVVRHA